MIKTAVILAAGLGSRLKDKTKEMPKGFLEIGGKPIVLESVRKLMEAGIENIIIGTGHISGAYEELAIKNPLVRCCKNMKYADTGSMYTLYNLRELIKDDFLLLESDLVYDKTGLWVLKNDEHRDVILASGKTGSNDEVFIEADDAHFLINMSKKTDDLKSIYGELVGITRVSFPTFQKMCAYSEKTFPAKPKLDYEYALVNCGEPVLIRKIEDFAWCEIDDAHHLERAEKKVYPLIREREKLLEVKRNVLLNPGPATTTDSVKYAQVVPDICPREKDFGDVMEYVSKELASITGDREEYTAVLFGGSGTAAVEAIISSVIGDEALVIINNGAYGERMCQIARVYGMDVLEFASAPNDAIDLVKLENAIVEKQKNKKISHLSMVHHETTTGILNDIEAVGKICVKYGIRMIVDAISSYAAVPIDMKKMNISFLAASSNKNIQGMAGVCFVIAVKKDIEDTKNIKPRCFYLNLYKQYEYFLKNYQTRFTPPVQTLYALRQAIIEAKAEGIPERFARYCACWEVLIKGIERMKLKCLVPVNYQSKLITAIFEPETGAYDFEKMHDYFIENGFMIYPGKVSKFNTFRIANIGEMNSKDMNRFVDLLEKYLKTIRYL